jgi:hypothetical protein
MLKVSESWGSHFGLSNIYSFEFVVFASVIFEAEIVLIGVPNYNETTSNN